jgi:hypothetical protein
MRPEYPCEDGTGYEQWSPIPEAPRTSVLWLAKIRNDLLPQRDIKNAKRERGEANRREENLTNVDSARKGHSEEHADKTERSEKHASSPDGHR